MREDSRTFKSSKNAFFAILCQSITLLLSFVTRSIFIKSLSGTYLGLNGVFSNVISFLCLAELGVGNVLLYNLYKPLKNNDEKRVNQVLKIFRKLYLVIVALILFLGLLCVPLLPYILNGIEINAEVFAIYGLFLANAICSYLYAYKISYITATQRNYVISQVSIFTTIAKEILQIIILLLFHNYILFMLVTIITTIMKNIMLNIYANKHLMKIDFSVPDLEKKEKKKIFSDFKDIFLYKISNVVLYGTDNLLMSILIKGGTLIVGIYSNYLLITDSLNKLIGAGFQAFTASIGNLNAGDDISKQYSVFKALNFMAYWIYGVCCICMFLLVNPFINIFAGSHYLFPFSIVLIIIVAFYIDGTFTPIWIFRETTGSFKTSKYFALAQAIINIILSIILGMFWGVAGILGATIIARLMTTYWYEPRHIMKRYLNAKYTEFLKKHAIYLIKTIFTGAIIFFLFSHMVISNYFDFVLYGALIFITSNIIFLLLHFRDEEFQFLLEKIKLLRRKKDA